MDTHPSESESVAYLIEREEKLAAAKVCALVDRRYARDKESLRWDVLGVLVPRAIQHAKVSMLAWGNHLRVIVGSGNLTEFGYRRNLEVFGTIELSKEDGGDRAAVEQAIDFLVVTAGLAIGDEGPDTPKARVRQGLALIRKRIAKWPSNPPLKRNVFPIFGKPGQGALKQLTSEWPSGAPPRSASIVSPFFDRPGRDRETIGALISAMAKRRPREVYFSVRVEDLPNGKRRVFAPIDMVKEARKSCDVDVHAVTRLQENEVRDLHAKMLRVENQQWYLLLIGSSNFTAAGLGINPRVANLEANLVYRLKAAEGKKVRRLDAIWPEVNEEALDLDSTSLIWDPEPEEMEGSGDVVPLPDCFREAIFVPGHPGRLMITLTQRLPRTWNIRVPHGVDLLGSEIGTSPGRHELVWTEVAPPFVLEVSWNHGSGTAVANWPVNVSNPAILPAPEELTGLTLEELLAILSSTRPLHDAVTQVLQRRSTLPRTDVELDPLRRLDSQATLLRRTKRVAIALDRLRERLERPALSKDAFEWRLRGAIGPILLAEAFVREATLPGEAKFYLAELALALSRVRPALPAAGGLSARTISQLISAVVNELEIEARTLPPMPGMSMLDGYVNAAFEDARRA